MADEPLNPPGGDRAQQAKGAKSKRQRRLLMAAGAAVVLALVFLLQRGSDPAPAAAEEPDSGGAGAGTGGGDTAPPFGSTFADNGEAAGQLGTSITEGLAEVAAGLDGVNTSLLDLSDGQTAQGDTQPMAAASPTNITINTGAAKAARQARGARIAPTRTGDHAAAGLRRVGGKGNTYVDPKTGTKFHRVGKGDKSHFEKGPAGGGKGGKKDGAGKKDQHKGPSGGARAPAHRRPTTPPSGPRPKTAPPGVHGRRRHR